MIRYRGVTIDRYTRTVHYRGAVINFVGRYQFRMFCALLIGGPMTKKRMIEVIYGSDPEGGPLTGVRVIDVMLCNLRRSFELMGFALKREKTASQFYYWLEPAPVLTSVRDH